MRTYAFVFFSLILLAGCPSTAPELDTPNKQLKAIGGQLIAAQTAVRDYVVQPPCDQARGIVVACHDPEVKAVLQRLSREARTAYDNALDAASAGLDPRIVVVRTAVRKLTAELIRRNVK